MEKNSSTTFTLNEKDKKAISHVQDLLLEIEDSMFSCDVIQIGNCTFNYSQICDCESIITSMDWETTFSITHN